MEEHARRCEILSLLACNSAAYFEVEESPGFPLMRNHLRQCQGRRSPPFVSLNFDQNVLM
jgi:hypothetical protein